MLRLKSDGMGIQSVSLKKNGSASKMQPTDGFSVGPIGDRLYLAILSRISESDRTPLPSPKASHASEIGNWTKRVKNPPPTIKLRGAWSLNNNISPVLRALNAAVDDGRQKFTSSTLGFDACNKNQ